VRIDLVIASTNPAVGVEQAADLGDQRVVSLAGLLDATIQILAVRRVGHFVKHGLDA
jgi:hypothetical protein